jgi:hypothetical protein
MQQLLLHKSFPKRAALETWPMNLCVAEAAMYVSTTGNPIAKQKKTHQPPKKKYKTPTMWFVRDHSLIGTFMYL